MISADLLDEILAFCPTWDGVHRPRVDCQAELRVWIDSVGDVDGGVLASTSPRPRKHSQLPKESLQPAAGSVLQIVREMPGCTTYDVTVALRHRRHRGYAIAQGNVSRMLLVLEKAGKVRRVELSRRQARAAGGNVLWEAA